MKILILGSGGFADLDTFRHALTASGADMVTVAMRRIDQANIRHLPVIDDGKLYGIISIRDLYRSVKAQMEEDILLLAEMLIQS